MRPLEPQTAYPIPAAGLAFDLADEPILIDGMKVLFDIKVALYSVTIEPARGRPRGREAADGI